MPDRSQVPGIKMPLGAKEYVLAPLTLGQFFELEEEYNGLQPDAEKPLVGMARLRALGKFIKASLERNYTTVLRWDGTEVPLTEDVMFSDLLDLGNRENAFLATLAISGLKQVGETEPAKVEVQPLSPASTIA